MTEISSELLSQLLKQLTESTEEMRKLKSAIDNLNIKVDLFDKRIDEIEHNIASLGNKMYECCPVHEEVVLSMKNSISSIDNRVSETREEINKIEMEFKDEFKFRDRLMYGVIGTIVAQVISMIIMIKLK